jgi:hypothetical protein
VGSKEDDTGDTDSTSEWELGVPWQLMTVALVLFALAVASTAASWTFGVERAAAVAGVAIAVFAATGSVARLWAHGATSRTKARAVDGLGKVLGAMAASWGVWLVVLALLLGQGPF